MKTVIKLVLIATMATCVSCGKTKHAAANEAGNGIYYWKSVFQLSESDVSFLDRHNITQLYVKMFDVAPDRDWNTGETDVFPIATTRFKSPRPDNVNIIPTVYITIDALRRSVGKEESLAAKIVDRVFAMVSFNELGPISTVQFDCDWTESTRNSYFSLCQYANELLEVNGITLSGTIRLHQLKEHGLPFQKSVLMLYNLGGVADYDTRNSILDYNELEKYLNEQMDLLNMDFAYPTFGWGVLFRDGKLMALLHTADFSDTTYFQIRNDNSYNVIRPIEIEGHTLQFGDVVRLETSDIQDIMKTKERVEQLLGGHEHNNIIYHLDSLNLSKYSDNEISGIYSL